MCILFEQLNINHDVFNQVSFVLFLYSAVKTARQARCVTLICETQINVASRLLDVSTMPPIPPDALRTLFSEPVLHQRV